MIVSPAMPVSTALLLLVLLAGTAAQEPAAPPDPIGRWVMSDMGEYTEAYIKDPDGTSFGFLCGEGCLLYVDTLLGCESGEEYPALINTGGGAIPINMICHAFEDRHFFSTETREEYFEILRRGGHISFAIPLRGGRFQLARFSLSGAFPVVEQAVQTASRNRAKADRKMHRFKL
jgi:hypothetical protein